MSDPYSEEHCRAFRKYQGNDFDLGTLTDRERWVLGDEDPNCASVIKAWQKKRAAAAPGPDPLRFCGQYQARGYQSGEIVYSDNTLWVAAQPTSNPPSVDGGWEIVAKTGQAL